MTWLHNGVELDQPPDGAIGFIYCITRISTGRRYIGRKLLKFNRKKVVKGKSKRIITESDWREYFGSSKELQEEIALVGESDYKREILHFCYSKTELNYLESKEILDRAALFSDDYYNSWVSFRATKVHIASALKKHHFS